MAARRLVLAATVAVLAGLALAPAAMAGGSRPRGTLIKVIDHGRYGPILLDGHGQAIYGFTYDRRSRTRCFGACARAWPPVYTSGTPRAGRRVAQRKLGTIRRSNGRRQVTYNGWPLYTYVNEGRLQVFCHNVFQYRGLWLVIRPSGRLLR